MADEILQSFADRATMTQGLKKREFNYNDSFKFTITFDKQDMWDLTDKKPKGWLEKKIADTKAALIENIEKNFDNDVKNNLNPQMIDFPKPVNWAPPINPKTKKEEPAEGVVYLKEEYIDEKYPVAIEVKEKTVPGLVVKFKDIAEKHPIEIPIEEQDDSKPKLEPGESVKTNPVKKKKKKRKR